MKRVIDALTYDEVHAIIGLFHGRFATRNRCLVKLMLNTGLRIKEAVSLNVGDVFQNGHVSDDLYVRPETAKRKKARYIPLNGSAKAAIAEVLLFNRSNGFPTEPSDPLFVSQRLNPAGEHRLCPQAFQHIIRLRRGRLQTNLTVTPHLFRHTFITQVYRRTKDIQIAQELAGHASITTTTRYMHRTRGEKRAAVNLLDDQRCNSFSGLTNPSRVV
jgi:integrase/recombinase XerD